MPQNYDPKDGFHMGTLCSILFIIVIWSAFITMLLPNAPFLIRVYLPDVHCFPSL